MKFVELATFDSRLEAETIGHALDQYDIPFLVQSAGVGMFGMGMVGKSPGAAELLCRAHRGGRGAAGQQRLKAASGGCRRGRRRTQVSQPLSIASASGSSWRPVLNARSPWIVSLPSQSPK